jgi:hypothetical protein
MPSLNAHQRVLLAAVIDRIVPADADPAATGFGADRYILGQFDGQLAAEAPSSPPASTPLPPISPPSPPPNRTRTSAPSRPSPGSAAWSS